jgi:hypothetical protein
LNTRTKRKKIHETWRAQNELIILFPKKRNFNKEKRITSTRMARGPTTKRINKEIKRQHQRATMQNNELNQDKPSKRNSCGQNS